MKSLWDGKLEAVQEVGTKNIDVGTTLLKYFGVDSLVGKTMQDNISEYTKLKLEDNLTDTKELRLNELKALLDNTVANDFIYNKAYFNFLKFLKDNE